MEGPLAPDRLCYSGKSIEICCDGGFETTATVLHATGTTLDVAEVLPAGLGEVLVVFLAEHYRATASIVPTKETCTVAINGGFYPINLRTGPRAITYLQGVWYLRPPDLGIPMQVVNLSVTGLAILPIDGSTPKLRERRMIGFQLAGRVIKSIVELVEIEQYLWRMQFIKLGLSDEEEIAAFVIRSQVNERRRLSAVERQAHSILDPQARIRFPLIEEAHVGNDSITITAGGGTVALPYVTTRPSQKALIENLAGRCRLDDLRDILHYLNTIDLPEYERDLVLVGCSILKASHDGVSLHEILLSTVNLKQKTATTSIGGNILEQPGRPPIASIELPTIIDYEGQKWVMQTRSILTALFMQEVEPNHGSSSMFLPTKTDPFSFA